MARDVRGGAVTRPEDAGPVPGQPPPGEHTPGVEAPGHFGQWDEQRLGTDDDVEDLRARRERTDGAGGGEVRDAQAIVAAGRRDVGRPAVLAADERELAPARSGRGDRSLE